MSGGVGSLRTTVSTFDGRITAVSDDLGTARADIATVSSDLGDRITTLDDRTVKYDGSSDKTGVTLGDGTTPVTENLLINAGLAFNSDGDAMGRAGISFALGKGGRKQPSMIKDVSSMQQQMAAVQEMLLALKEKDEQKEATIKELKKRDEEKTEMLKKNEAMIQELKEALEEKK